MILSKKREGQQQPEVQQKVNNSNRIFLRLPSSYLPFFQAMAQDYYQRGKIESPSIGLLAKTCLLTAGNAWNRMMIQIMNKEWERKQAQQRGLKQEQPQQNYQQRREFVQSSEDLMPQSVPNVRPPPFVVGEILRQPQQDVGNLVNGSMKERGDPTFTQGLDSSSMTWKRPRQYQLESQPEDQLYRDENDERGA